MNDFDIGYNSADANGSDPEFSLDGKSTEYIDGYTKRMRELSFLEGNPDTDSFDY